MQRVLSTRPYPPHRIIPGIPSRQSSARSWRDSVRGPLRSHLPPTSVYAGTPHAPELCRAPRRHGTRPCRRILRNGPLPRRRRHRSTGLHPIRCRRRRTSARPQRRLSVLLPARRSDRRLGRTRHAKIHTPFRAGRLHRRHPSDLPPRRRLVRLLRPSQRRRNMGYGDCPSSPAKCQNTAAAGIFSTLRHWRRS